jgi:hypothetical protein
MLLLLIKIRWGLLAQVNRIRNESIAEGETGRTGDEQNNSDDHMGFRICVDYIKR